MKAVQFLSLCGVCALTAASPLHAALMDLSKPAAETPYYADFTVNNLEFKNTYSQSTGEAAFSIRTVGGTTTESYYSSPQSGGTHGNENGTFNGSFTLDAKIKKNTSGVWELQPGGAFTVKGNLLPGGTTSDILLYGNLISGVSGPNGTFGFRDTASGPKRFEFLYTVDTTLGNAANGKDLILQDWATVNASGTPVVGGMIFTLNTLNQFPSGLWFDWSQSFMAQSGYGDVFIPEPSTYGLLGAALSALAFGFSRRSMSSRSSRC